MEEPFPDPDLSKEIPMITDEPPIIDLDSLPDEPIVGEPPKLGEKAKRVLPGWMTNPPEPEQEKDQDDTTQISSRQQLKSSQKEAFVDEIPLVSWPCQDIEDILQMKGGRVICFDVETTGFSRQDGIIEIGAVEIIDGFRTGCLFQSYLRPRKDIHPKAQEVHRLTEKKLESAPPFQLVLASFMEWVGNSPLIAHNARFDVRLLLQDLTILELGCLIDNRPVFCTMKHFRKEFPGTSYALNNLASRFDISLDYRTSHSALADAEVLAKGFQALLARKVKPQPKPNLPI